MYDDDNYEPQIYTIPVNITDDGGVLGGRIKKRNMFEAVVLFVILLILWKIIFYPYSLIIKTITFLALIVPIVSFALVGINDESFLEFLFEFLIYKKKRRKMFYRLPMKINSKRKKRFSKKEEE